MDRFKILERVGALFGLLMLSSALAYTFFDFSSWANVSGCVWNDIKKLYGGCDGRTALLVTFHIAGIVLGGICVVSWACEEEREGE